MKSILFVYLGNICRTPLAHGIAQNYIKKYGFEQVFDMIEKCIKN